MANTRFQLDPERIFPDHAYAPGYEPAPRAPDPEEARERVIGMGELARFAFAVMLVMAGMAAISSLIMAA